jgi:hypothetical protein
MEVSRLFGVIPFKLLVYNDVILLTFVIAWKLVMHCKVAMNIAITVNKFIISVG